MKYIISGTDRPGSRTLEVALLVQGIYTKLGEATEIIDLRSIDLELATGSHYGGSDQMPPKLKEAVMKIDAAEGLIVVCPEYNGSMPGALKYFIDFWRYPQSFEGRPIALVGLGGRFGGLRPVEHLQGVFGFRNSFIFPTRVFLNDVWSNLKDGKLQDARLMTLLEVQATGFQRFVRALKSEGLDANSILNIQRVPNP